MSLNDFVVKWQGKFLEIAGSAALNQCVDLANGFIRDVLGLPIIEWTNARDFPTKAGDNYDYIGNTPDGIPKESDLVIWNNTTNGHIAVFIEGNVDSFRSFDQNYPTGTPCHIQNHNYNGVSGWLHPKQVTQATTAPSGSNFQSIEQIIIDSYMVICGEGPNDDEKKYRIEHWTNTTDFLKSLMGDSRFTKIYIDPVVKEKDDEILHLKDSIQAEYLKDTDFGDQLHTAQKELEDLKTQLAECQKQTPPQPSAETISWLTKLLDFFRRR